MQLQTLKKVIAALEERGVNGTDSIHVSRNRYPRSDAAEDFITHNVSVENKARIEVWKSGKLTATLLVITELK